MTAAGTRGAANADSCGNRPMGCMTERCREADALLEVRCEEMRRADALSAEAERIARQPLIGRPASTLRHETKRDG
jgi:hypothetical protein